MWSYSNKFTFAISSADEFLVSIGYHMSRAMKSGMLRQLDSCVCTNVCKITILIIHTKKKMLVVDCKVTVEIIFITGKHFF